MRPGPVLKKDLTVLSRSHLLPGLFLVLNVLLFLFGMAGMSGLTALMRGSLRENYRDFVGLFSLTVLLDYLLLMLMAPALTAGAIGAEKNSGNLDLMLMSSLKSRDVVLGKLLAAFTTAAVMLVSALPFLSMPLLYGGSDILLILRMLAAMLTGILYGLSAGLLAGALSADVLRSAILAYLLLLVPGILLPLPYLIAGEQSLLPGFLLLLDPFQPMMGLLAESFRGSTTAPALQNWIRQLASCASTEHALIAQLILSLLMLAGAVRLTGRKKG